MHKLDYLPNTDFKMIQKKEFYHFNSDTTLLGNFITIKRKDHVLDVGCHSGALLLYASQFQPSYLCGIDLYPEVIENAKENMQLNQVEAELFVSTLQDFKHSAFDVILCNPPYFNTTKKQLKNENPILLAARHEDYLPLNDLFYHSQRLLKDKGVLYLVHRPERLSELIIKAHQYGLSLSEMQVVFDKNTNKSRTILLKYKKSLHTELKILEPLSI